MDIISNNLFLNWNKKHLFYTQNNPTFCIKSQTI